MVFKKGVKIITKDNADMLELSQASKDGKIRAKIILEQINGKLTDEATNKCNSVKYILMLDFVN